MVEKILVTGSAGFIGFHLSKRLIKEGFKVIGLDNMNDYYDVSLKIKRVSELNKHAKEENFIFLKCDISNKEFLKNLFCEYKPDKVVNLAAQAGVRYSIENPSAYIQSNIVGFANILEECKNNKIKHLVYASSSSVYGGNRDLPFSEKSGVDHPVSLYAATKRSNELMAHTYSHLFNLPTTGLRFFTVYGPWGRPDMALFKFTELINNEMPIEIYNNGDMERSFTYIDDVIESLFRIINLSPKADKLFLKNKPDPSQSWSPFRVFNIGNSQSSNLLEYVEEIEKYLGKKAIRNYLPLQPGDVPSTCANTNLLEEYVNFKPSTKINKGIAEFIKWYKKYYGII